MAKKRKNTRDKHIGDYLHTESGQSVAPEAQWAGCVQHKKISNEILGLRDMQDVLKRSGLDKEAKMLNEKINQKEIERKELELRLDQEHREMSFALLMCFCACDVATACADEFGATMNRISKGMYGKDNDFSQMVREQADSFNKIVQQVDEGDNMALSMFYADIAETVIERVLPVMREVIQDYHNTEKGRRYF